MNLQGKTFIVTGGASGLGAACVKRFASNGAQVAIFDMGTKGEGLAKECGKKVKFFSCDITREAEVQSGVKGAVSEFGALHGLINCAGIATGEKVLNKEGKPHGFASFTKTIDVNLNGTFNVIRIAVQAMVKDPTQKTPPKETCGVIVNTASVAAFDGQIGQAAYAASKGAIAAMTLPLARELANFGIRVVTIAPGIFETPMLAGLDEKVQASLGQMVPFPSRLGKPDEYAHLAQHICENEMINGEVIRLDGAIRMAPK